MSRKSKDSGVALTDPDEALNEESAAEFLGQSVRTLQKWRYQGIGPRYLKYGTGRPASVRYLRSDLEAFRTASLVDPSQGRTA